MQFASTREHRSSVQRSLIDAWVVVIHTQAKERTLNKLFIVQGVPRERESQARENETTFLNRAVLLLLQLNELEN
jgi:hypothetical protein